MILTQGEQMLVTPTGYVYEMYAPHQGAAAVRSLIETEQVPFRKGDQTIEMAAFAGSASLKGNTLFLTLTYCHADLSIEVKVD
jgi:alpha-N-arabinofuranosidase